MIRAEVHSDDRNVEVEFDATEWFEQASDDEIEELANFHYGGDYPADGVAEFFDRKGKNSTAPVFRYLKIIRNDASKGDCCGFECHVNQEDAETWIKANRPALASKLEIE